MRGRTFCRCPLGPASIPLPNSVETPHSRTNIRVKMKGTTLRRGIVWRGKKCRCKAAGKTISKERRFPCYQSFSGIPYASRKPLLIYLGEERKSYFLFSPLSFSFLILREQNPETVGLTQRAPGARCRPKNASFSLHMHFNARLYTQRRRRLPRIFAERCHVRTCDGWGPGRNFIRLLGALSEIFAFVSLCDLGTQSISDFRSPRIS
jgi:hypothetical protein